MTYLQILPIKESRKKSNAYYYGLPSYLTKKYKGIIVANFI